MQTRMRQIAMGMGLLLAAGCAGKQVSDYSPATRFSQYRTFALVMPPDTGAQQLLDQRVRNAVQAQLTAKGLTLTDRQNADVYVGYGIVDKATQTSMPTAMVGAGAAGGAGDTGAMVSRGR